MKVTAKIMVEQEVTIDVDCLTSIPFIIEKFKQMLPPESGASASVHIQKYELTPAEMTTRRYSKI